MTQSPSFRLGTRGSPLALSQASLVGEALRRAQPGITLETVIIRTTGDAWALQGGRTPGDSPDPALSEKGMFTKELEEALLQDRIDLAVHSLKDLPVSFHGALTLAALLPRANPQDVLIGREPFTDWSDLPAEFSVATGSLRRSCQLRAIRPDVQVVDIRGNIETRLRKLRENPEWYGIILAAAGLDRLHPDLESLTVTPIDAARMLPAPGQGVIALQARSGDSASAAVAQSLHCAETHAAVTAERAMLQGLGGGCRSPVGAFGRVEGDELQLTGIYFPDPSLPGRRGILGGLASEAEILGQRLARELLAS